MIQIREIRKNEYDDLYSHMKRDFPANEIPPFFVIKRNFEKNIYDGFFLTENIENIGSVENIDIGYAVITAPENLKYAFINFFAVFPQYRSKGYGSEFLKIILNRYSDRTLVLEADNPSAAKTAALHDEAERRLKFYECAGFRVVPTAKAKIFGVDMVIMASTASGYDEKLSAREIMHALYLPALGAKHWLRFIDVIDLIDIKEI